MLRTIAIAAALGLVACSQSGQSPQDVRCTDCAPGSGAVQMALAVNANGVARVAASVTAPDLASPITADLGIAGTPPVASGTIPNVPSGEGRLVTLQAFAPAPEDTVVIYRGSATVSVEAGLLSQASVTLAPVVADLAVQATFPAGDLDVARVDHVSVVVSGARIAGSPSWYLTLAQVQGTASGTASGVPVGASRTVTVRTYDASGTILHQGAATTAVVEGASNSVAVALVNQGGTGSISVGGSFCVPDCTGKVCGDDGCGGSCGGCEPGITCSAGACGGGTVPPPPGPSSWKLVMNVPENPTCVWGSGPDDVWIAGLRTIRHFDGTTWSTHATTGPLNGIWGSGPNDVWAVGGENGSGTILHWDGTRWTTTIVGMTLTAVWGSSASDVWATGSGTGNFLHWNGSTWSAVPVGTTLVMNGVWGSGPNDVWAVGQRLLHWNGAAWTQTPIASTTYLWNVWGSGPNDVWAVGNRSDNGDGLLMHWNGSAWSTSAAGSHQLYGVWGSAASDVWAGSVWGAPAQHFDGTAWSMVDVGTYASIVSLWGSGPNDVWGVGWNPNGFGTGVILHYAP